MNKTSPGKQRHIARAIALLSLPLGGAIQAQTGGEVLPLETVIVTAQRYEQSVNDVGMDIQAYQGRRLEQLRLDDVTDLTAVVPSFTMAQSYQGVPTYTLRGVGFNTINMSATSTVGTYVDEAAYPYPILNAGPMFDLERVEVLKGPQGTLFGRNTTAGLINLVTRKPTDAFEAIISAEVGNNATYNFEGMVSGPLSAGIRYSEDDQDYAGCSRDFNGSMLSNVNVSNRALFLQTYGALVDPIGENDCNIFDPEALGFGIVESELNEHNVAWRLVANWTPTVDTLFYASLSQGTKAGVTPVNAANISTQNAPGDPGGAAGLRTGRESDPVRPAGTGQRLGLFLRL